MTLRRALKKAYLRMPFNQPVFSALRRVWTPPASVYRYLYFRGVFPIDVRGKRFLLPHYGDWIETELFWRGLYGGWEAQSLRLWTDLSERSQVIIDVGANTGIYALLARTVNPSARVYAFEPIERVYDKLVANVRLNHFDIDCRLNAVVRRKVGVVRLDTFLREQNVEPDLIKIDVESREPEVLEGFGSYIEQRRPAMLVEVWHDEDQRANEQDGDLHIGSRIEALVSGKGYRFYRIDEKSGPVAAEHIGMPGRGYSNYLLCSEEKARKIGLP